MSSRRVWVLLWLAAAAFLVSPTLSEARTTFRIVVKNTTSSDLKLVGTDNNCWYINDLAADKAVEVNPGQTGLMFTEDKASGSCYSETSSQNLELIFKGPDNKYPNPYNGAISKTDSFPYSAGENGAWDLLSRNSSLFMRNWPKGPLPINPGQSGSQASSPSKGMFCLTVSQPPTDKKLISLTVRPGTDCYGPAARPRFVARGLRPAKAGPPPKITDTQTVYDLFQIGKAACYLTRPSQAWGFTGCEDIGADGQWDLHNVKNDVSDAETSSDARVIGSTKVVAKNTYTNNTSAKGESGWKFSYKLGDETSTETESGWKVGGKIEWAKKFHIPIIGEFEQKLEISLDHEWGEKKEQKHSVEKEVEQDASIEAEPHHKTTMLVKQNQATLMTSFSAKLWAGTKGIAEPIKTPAVRSLGMSAARNQPCIGSLAGNSPNSLMGLAAYARGQGWTPETVGLPEEQRAFLEAAKGLKVADDDRCPGYPGGYPARFAFEGTASYKAQAGGPTSADSFAPSLPEVDICAYSEKLPGFGDAAPDNTPNEACHPGAPPALDEYGTIVDGSQAPTGTVEGDNGGSLVIADETSGGAPRGGKLRTYQGRNGEDILQGGKFSEKLLGGGNQDVLTGSDGNDRLNGQAGDDTLSGNKGKDSLTDVKGSNALFGNKGSDFLSSRAGAKGGLFGGAGGDKLVMTGKGRVTLLGGPGNDTYKLLSGARGRSVVEMPNQGFDTVVTDHSLTLTPYVDKAVAKGARGVRLGAGDGDQRLLGSKGNDTLAGGSGSDLLKGRRGNDRLLLQPFGFDLAVGGPGADRFKVTDRRPGASRVLRRMPLRSKSAHVIRDFKPAQGDRIVLPTSSFGSKLKALKSHKIMTRGAKPRGKKPQFLFAPSRKLLSFDPDGRGRKPARVIAVFKGRDGVPKRSIRIFAGT